MVEYLRMFARKVFVISAALAAAVSAAPSPTHAGTTTKATTKAKSTAAADKPKAQSKPAKPKNDGYTVDANTPGTDSDEWRTADTVVGGADRIEGNEADKNLVAFTFDDGPDKNTTPLVLDALDRYNIPAAFFIVTQRIVGKHGEIPRQLLEREYKAGHLIGSHSVTHKHLGKASGVLLDKEVDGSLRTLVRITGRHVGLFRPPFGALSKEGKTRVSQRGLTNTLWSIDTLDWQAKSGEKLRAKVGKMILADKGGVVLMHDVKKITADVVAGIFDDLEADNCAKLAAGQPPIIPVSLHYFLKRGKEARPIPAEVAARTEAYRRELPNRCAKRPAIVAKPATTTPAPAPARPATAAPGVGTGVIPVTPPR
ncbi:MAG TPA: polysaccharide deacetylase family protein [Kofleriaceae bacterium]|nr:polysaccharide deacetylase family protein [Kofleriaceae bacterium]